MQQKLGKPYLIVNGDDFGRTPGVSRGVLDAHRRGIVTSTTALMNMPAVEEALAGKQLTAESLDPLVPMVQDAVSPIDDIRATAAYRRKVAGNLLLRLARYGPGMR